MDEMEKIHRHLFGDETPFSDEMRDCVVGMSKSNVLLKNQCSEGYPQLTKGHEKPDQSKKKYQKKRRQKKTKKSLTFEKSKRIFVVFLYYLNYLRGHFLASTGYHNPGEKVPQSGGKVPQSRKMVSLLGEYHNG